MQDKVEFIALEESFWDEWMMVGECPPFFLSSFAIWDGTTIKTCGEVWHQQVGLQDPFNPDDLQEPFETGNWFQ